MHFSTLVVLDDLSSLDDKMEPFASEPDNEEYLEFYDETDDLKNEFETALITAIQMPSGKLISSHELNHNRYQIKNNNVYEKIKCGTYIKTPRASKIIVMPNMPARNVYKTYRSYATRHVGSEYHKDKHKFGYYTNPDAMWDWWSLGGRYSGKFLVKKNCEDCFECTDLDCRKYVPKGYKPVDAARIGDIEWDVMYKILVKEVIKKYYEYKRIYLTRIIPEHSGLHIDKENETLTYFGETLYTSGESLDDYVNRAWISKNTKYNLSCYYYLNYDDEWETQQGSKKEWNKKISKEMASLDKDLYLAMVDCYM